MTIITTDKSAKREGSRFGNIKLGIIALLFTLGLLSTASAVSDNWTAGSGNWNNGGNWSAGVPNPTFDQTIIANGGIATIDSAVPTIGQFWGRNGSITQYAGSISTDGSPFFMGTFGGGVFTYNLSGGSVIMPGTIAVGRGGSTTFNQTGG